MNVLYNFIQNSVFYVCPTNKNNKAKNITTANSLLAITIQNY